MVTLLPILPEILLLLLGVLILILDPFLKKDSSRRPFLGWFTAVGFLSILVISLAFARPAAPTLVFGGMLRFDWLGFIFMMFFVSAAGVTSLFFMDVDHLNHRAEAYLLLVIATLGMCLMGSSADLVMLYLAIETTSIPLYLLAGFLKGDDKSTEAGFKYMLFGALTSAILLYGFSLIYGFTGKTGLYDLSTYFSNFNLVAVGITFLVLVGLAFKVSLFPFHFWAPDVYEGAPTPVAGFLSTASKAAGFAVLIRLFTAVFPIVSTDWSSDPGNPGHPDHDCWQLDRPGAEKYQTHAGLFIHCTRRLCHDRRCSILAVGYCQHSLLLDWLCSDQSACFWHCRCRWKCHRFRRLHCVFGLEPA